MRGWRHENKNGSQWLPFSKDIPKSNDNTSRNPGQEENGQKKTEWVSLRLRDLAGFDL